MSSINEKLEGDKGSAIAESTDRALEGQDQFFKTLRSTLPGFKIPGGFPAMSENLKATLRWIYRVSIFHSDSSLATSDILA